MSAILTRVAAEEEAAEAMASKTGKGTGRRPKGDGTIYYREDRAVWTAQVTLDGGKRRTIYGATQREVSEKLRQLNRDRDRGALVAGERQTVAHYLTTWLETKKTEGIRAATYHSYSDHIRLHLIPTLGKLTLEKLTQQPARLDTLYAALLDGGLSRQTVRHIHAVLHNALEDAVRRELVPRNVADVARPPRLPAQRRPIWTTEQWHTFRAAHHEDRLIDLYTVIVNTCLRVGEAMALAWADVDLACGTVTVHQGRQKDWDRAYTTGPTKTEAGHRTIALTDDACAALTRQKRRQAEERLHAGSVWRDHDLVFSSQVGTHLDHSAVEHRWTRLVAACPDLPPIHIHDLRHSGASILLASGMELPVVSEMLGHADITTTARVYAHVLPTRRREAAEAMQRAMDQGRASTPLSQQTGKRG